MEYIFVSEFEYFLNNEVRCTKYDVRDMPSVARLILIPKE